MAKQRRIKDYFILLLKGAGMGASDVVPGVSGGTIAFITDIYEELVNSIKSINFKSFKSIFTDGIKEFWHSINGNFLVSVFAGILISVFTLANLLETLLRDEPILVWSFFFGLIIASAVYVSRKITDWDWKKILAVLAGIIVAYLITSISPAKTSEAYWFVFISGAIAICAMILPGISGAFILLILGKYQFILGAVNDLNFAVLAVFAIGALVGLISFSNVLSWFLRKFHDLTVAVLSGFMIGSLYKIWPWKRTVSTFTDSHGEVQPLVQKNILPGQFECATGDSAQLIAALVAAASGILLIFILGKITKSKAQS